VGHFVHKNLELPEKTQFAKYKERRWMELAQNCVIWRTLLISLVVKRRILFQYYYAVT